LILSEHKGIHSGTRPFFVKHIIEKHAHLHTSGKNETLSEYGNAVMNYARLITMLFCAGFLLIGWTDSWESIRKESANISSISASFTQTKRMKILTSPLVSNGTFCFKGPNSVRWAYDEPVKSVLLLHRGTSKRFTQRHNSSWTEDAGIGAEATSVMLQEIILWSTGRFTECKGFTAELLAGTAPRIHLRPCDGSLAKIISGIEIIPAIDKPGMIQSIIIREGEGNTTTLDFADVKINVQLEDKLFRKP